MLSILMRMKKPRVILASNAMEKIVMSEKYSITFLDNINYYSIFIIFSSVYVSAAHSADSAAHGAGLKAQEAYDFAQSVAGEDDRIFYQLYNDVLKSQLAAKLSDAAIEPKRVGPQLSPGLTTEQVRLREANALADEKSILADPRFSRNFRSLVIEIDPSTQRIFGGNETNPGDYPGTVAVGSETKWQCTGTLVAPRVVITAGHCAPSVVHRIFVGVDVNDAVNRDVVRVQDYKQHEKYQVDGDIFKHDLTVLILERQPLNSEPRRIASTLDIDSAQWGRAVGFGATDRAGVRGYGKQRKVDIAIASKNCNQLDAQRYKCHVGHELVAQSSSRDSCSGDSGGPFFVKNGGEWLLAAATSRATAEWRIHGYPCGEGGNYVRIDKHMSWINNIADQYGVARPNSL